MPVKFQDYYQTLGVTRNASQDDIQRAYRKLARQYHPDVNKEAGAEARFRAIGEAYEVLKDPTKRKKYDELGENWKHGQEFRPPPGYEGMHFEFRPGGRGGARGGPGGGPGGGFSFQGGGQFSDFFEAFFGGAGPGAGGGGGGGGRGGAGFDFEELLRGAQQQQQQRGPRMRTHGTRHGPQQAPPDETEMVLSLEEAFHGGSKRIELRNPQTGQSKTVDVKIPAGVKDHSRIRLRGQGTVGNDLHIRIRLAPHPRFALDGHDLTTDLPLSPWEAALGTKLTLPTLNGDVTLTVPAGASTGSKLRLAGRGLPKRGGERGDLFARVKIVVPRTLSDEERELFEALKEKSEFNPRQ